MVGIGIEIHAECRTCGQRIPVDAMVPRVVCDRCKAEMPLTDDDWKTLAGDSLKSVLKLAEGFGEKGTLYAHGFFIYCTLGRATPKFAMRDEPVPAEQIIAVGSGYVFHPSTGGACSVRAVPAEYAKSLKGVTHLVGEDLGLLAQVGEVHEGIAPLKVDAAHGLKSQCPQCGGDVPVEGGQRLVTCPFCATVSYLDDAQYFAARPDRLARRWYLFLADTEAGEGEIPDVSPCALLPPALATIEPLPEDRQRPVWMAVRATTLCETCEAPIPLRAFVETVPCARCGSLTPFPPERWFEAFMDVLRILAPDEEGEELSGFKMGRIGVNYTVFRRAPRYPGTREPIPDALLLEALTSGAVSARGGRITVRELDEPFRKAFPSVSWVVGEDPAWLPVESLAAQQFAPEVAAIPVPLTCEACGGTISADGGSRSVSCGFCGAAVNLSSEIMRQLHPSEKEHTFYLRYDDSMFPVQYGSLAAAAPLEGGRVLMLASRGEEEIALRVLDSCYRQESSTPIPKNFRKQLEEFSSYDMRSLGRGRFLLWPREYDAVQPFYLFDLASGELERIVPRGAHGKIRRILGVVDGGRDTLLVLHEPADRIKELPRGHTLLLERFSLDGELRPTWDRQAPPPGFWKKVGAFFSDGIDGAAFEETGHYPLSVPNEVLLEPGAPGEGAFLLRKGQVLPLKPEGQCGERFGLNGVRRILGFAENGAIVYSGKSDGAGTYAVRIREAGGEERVVPDTDHSEDGKIFFDGERIHNLGDQEHFTVVSLEGETLLTQIGED